MVGWQRRSAVVHSPLLVFGRVNLRGRPQRGRSNRARPFVFHPHILACLEILVVRHPSFTLSPIHHSAHLLGGAVHLIGPNRTRIGTSRPSIVHISFGWRQWCGQIDRHRPIRQPCAVGGVLDQLIGCVGVVDAGAALGCGPPPSPTRPGTRRVLPRLAVSIGRPYPSSPRRDAAALARPAILAACSDNHVPIGRPVPTAPGRSRLLAAAAPPWFGSGASP
jgi:hypothetical protein